MPRWLPDSFDAIAHNARVRSMRSALREQDAARRVVIGNGGERVATDHITGGGVDGASPGSPLSDTKSGPPTHQRSGPSASPGSSTTLRPTVPAAPFRPTADHSLPTASGRALVLPWPPSGNTAVRHGGGAHYLRPEVAQYRRHVAALCRSAERCTGRYVLHVHLSPPDARRRDADNAIKVLIDALTHSGLICDDSMAYMRELHVTVDDARNGSAIVRVAAA